MNTENNMENTEALIQNLTMLSCCANIQLSEALNDFTMKAEKKILEKHKYAIYFSEKENAWRTYLPDDTKPNKRKPLKRNTRQNLEKEIIRFYMEKQKKEDRTMISLEEVYKEWLIYRRDYTPAKAKTIQENKSDWEKFFADTTLAKMPIAEIRPITLIRFFRALTKERTYTHKRISNLRSVINGIMSYAIEEEIIEHNPVSDVNFKQFAYKPVENQCDNVFSQEEAVKLLTYLKDKNEPYALAISLSFYLFIRIGETKALRWKDIDYEHRTIYLHGQILQERILNDDLSFSPRTVILSDQMKGNTSNGFRKQYLTDEALEILERARLLNPSGTFIFEPYNKKPMTTDRFNRRLKAYCEECGISYHSSHKIRFYNASTAYNGENLTTISKLMGHSRVETTLHYLRNVDRGNDDSLAFQNLGLSSIKENGVQKCSKNL